jgi:two-component system chemotaxis sensor kinase CheA
VTDSEGVEFLEIFHDEARERLDSIESVLLGAETGTAGIEAIDSLFRDAHTIKGAASMLGFDDVRALAHALEDVLQEARDAGVLDPSLVEPLLRAADALRSLVEGKEAPPEVLQELRSLTDASPPAKVMAVAPRSEAEERSEPPARAIRVSAQKLDQLLDLAGEAVLHRRRLEHVLAPAPADEQLEDELQLGERLLGELQQTAIGMRMLPLSSIAAPFSRAVRDAAASRGKDVEFVVVGGETELDRVILETLPEPLAHLLRNAVAHGIELPEDREAAGKQRCGRVELRAEQRAGYVVLTIADDGAGVAAEVLERARGTSLADVLADPGFSTAGALSDLAGRGVGLDAVKRHAESLGGSLDVASDPGRGTSVSLTLPVTLALLEVLLVERASTAYGLPLAAVEETIRVERRMSLEGREAVEVRGEAVPLADLAALLGLPAPPVSDHAVVLAAGGRRVAVACDRPLGHEEVVVKRLGPLLDDLPAYLGAAVLGDGRVALLLDAPWLVRRAASGAPPRREEPAPPEAPKRVLVVEDSLTVRELQRSILESAGYLVSTARDGREALDRLESDPEIALVVSDLEMPELDGLALTRAIRSRPATAALPVVIVTTHGSDEDRSRGLEAGADAYVLKHSYKEQAFLETVARLLSR